MKKTITTLIVLLMIINNVRSQPETIWQLLQNGDIIRWAYSGGDEFNGTSLDESKWLNSYPWGRNYSGTCYQEYMTDGQNFQFDISQFSKGIYYLTGTFDGKIISEKIILE